MLRITAAGGYRHWAVTFGERIIAMQLAARGLSRRPGHSKYKKLPLRISTLAEQARPREG